MQIKRGGGGFTLAELLIVMAIIVVLAAVAIPTFGKQLETSRETGDMEIIRNAYTEALSVAILDGADGAINGIIGDGTTDDATNNSLNLGAVTKYTVGGTYTVSLTTMKAKFSQSATSKAWTYVNGKLMNNGVPEVDQSVTEIKFAFEITDGEVKLKADTGTAPSITLVGITI